jgi:hypothetical protein
MFCHNTGCGRGGREAGGGFVAWRILAVTAALAVAQGGAALAENDSKRGKSIKMLRSELSAAETILESNTKKLYAQSIAASLSSSHSRRSDTVSLIDEKGKAANDLKEVWVRIRTLDI